MLSDGQCISRFIHDIPFDNVINVAKRTIERSVIDRPIEYVDRQMQEFKQVDNEQEDKRNEHSGDWIDGKDSTESFDNSR